jgi:guanylate kinase
MPPALSTLKKRLESRKTDEARSISNRLRIAKREIGYKHRYDYVVVNDSLDAAYRKLRQIIIEETDGTKRRTKKCRTCR